MVTGSPAARATAGPFAAGLAASFLMVAVEASAETSAMIAWTQVVVRVYDTTGLPRPSRQRALAEARAALVTASVDIVWIDCAESANACQSPPAPRERIVRLVNARAAAHPQRLPLGTALIDSGERTSVLATIYVDRVRRVAAGVGADEVVLVGRAIAHELGHLLTGANTHARFGLMRRNWTDEELRRERREDWTFSPDFRLKPEAGR